MYNIHYVYMYKRYVLYVHMYIVHTCMYCVYIYTGTGISINPLSLSLSLSPSVRASCVRVCVFIRSTVERMIRGNPDSRAPANARRLQSSAPLQIPAC